MNHTFANNGYFEPDAELVKEITNAATTRATLVKLQSEAKTSDIHGAFATVIDLVTEQQREAEINLHADNALGYYGLVQHALSPLLANTKYDDGIPDFASVNHILNQLDKIEANFKRMHTAFDNLGQLQAYNPFTDTKRARPAKRDIREELEKIVQNAFEAEMADDAGLTEQDPNASVATQAPPAAPCPYAALKPEGAPVSFSAPSEFSEQAIEECIDSLKAWDIDVLGPKPDIVLTNKGCVDVSNNI